MKRRVFLSLPAVGAMLVAFPKPAAATRPIRFPKIAPAAPIATTLNAAWHDLMVYGSCRIQTTARHNGADTPKGIIS